MDTPKKTKKLPQLAQTETIENLPAICADESAARAFIESQRWGASPFCPHCGDTSVYRMKGESVEKRGVMRCHGCKKQFTVRIGSIFEDSKFPLTLWCRAMWESIACKNGVSALELARKLQITHKSALFMMHRLRHAMADSPFNPPPKLTGEVQVDETYVGPRKPRYKQASNKNMATVRHTEKQPVLALVQHGGEVRTRVIANVRGETLRQAIRDHVDPSATIVTDEWTGYSGCGKGYAGHRTVKHRNGEYVKADGTTTNTVESFFSRVKRGLIGTYHGVSPDHLHRYMAQFAFSYNTREMNDGERLCELIRRTAGKRLVYKPVADLEAA